jgi:hypothetical protein
MGKIKGSIVCFAPAITQPHSSAISLARLTVLIGSSAKTGSCSTSISQSITAAAILYLRILVSVAQTPAITGSSAASIVCLITVGIIIFYLKVLLSIAQTSAVSSILSLIVISGTSFASQSLSLTASKHRVSFIILM